MPEACRHVVGVAGDVVGQHDSGRLAQAIEKVGPRATRQQVVCGGISGAGCLTDRMWHPGRVHERRSHGAPSARA